jgi:hypothetical protein
MSQSVILQLPATGKDVATRNVRLLITSSLSSDRYTKHVSRRNKVALTTGNIINMELRLQHFFSLISINR